MLQVSQQKVVPLRYAFTTTGFTQLITSVSVIHCFKLSVNFTELSWQQCDTELFCKIYMFCKFYRKQELQKITDLTELFCKLQILQNCSVKFTCSVTFNGSSYYRKLGEAYSFYIFLGIFGIWNIGGVKQPLGVFSSLRIFSPSTLNRRTLLTDSSWISELTRSKFAKLAKFLVISSFAFSYTEDFVDTSEPIFTRLSHKVYNGRKQKT